MSRSILILTHEFPPTTGGAATYVRETARAAAQLGHAVSVWAPAGAGADDGGLAFAVRRLPLRGNQNWPDRLRLARAVKQAPLDWGRTTLFLPEPGPLRLWLYARELNLPRPRELVLALHGSEILRFVALPHRRRRFERLLDQADRVGVVSSAIADLLRRHTAVDPRKIVLVPGALIPGAAPLTASPSRAEDRLRVLTVGRVHPRKGQLAVIEALGHLPAELRTRIVYQIVGRIRDRGYARQLERQARLAGVALEGPRELPEPALPSAYAEADLFVMASQPHGPSIEGFGLVYLEAARHRLPVVGVDTGGVRDAIGPDNGLLVPAADPSALAAAMARLLRDAALRQRFGAAGPAWASRFSWEANVRRLFPD